MAKIGYRTLNLVKEQLGHLLDSYAVDIDEAYIKAEKSLNISMGISLTPDNKGVKIKTSISFVSEKITDEMQSIFDESQVSFEFDVAPKKEAEAIPPPDSDLPPTDDEMLDKLTQEQ